MSVVPGRVRKNLTGIIVEVDDLVLDVLGFTRADMIGHRSTEFFHPDDHEQAFSSWIRMLGEPEAPHTVQVRHRNVSGRWLWVQATNVIDASDPEVVHTEMVLIDRPVDDRTSVSNHMLRHLAEALPFGIAQIDSDRRIVFSNGKLDEVTGRIGGEHLAERFGYVLPAARPILDAGVLGGDEFLVVAGAVRSTEQAHQLARRLVRAVRRPVDIGGTVIRPATSVGVAWSADPAALVARADAAMYRTKRREVPARH